MRTMSFLLAILVCALAIAIGSYYYFQPPVTEFTVQELQVSSKDDIAKVRKQLKDSQPQEALKTIKKYKNLMESENPEGKIWLSLLLQASEDIPEPSQLVILYEHSPDQFSDKEKASLIVADSYIRRGQADKYAAIREVWKGREQKPEAWFLLDADEMLLKGNRAEAIEFLKSKTFEEKKDTGRLVRLGLLNILADPQTAWQYFTEAVRKDPINPDLRSYRAKLLEASGNAGVALQEYSAAMQLAPQNLYYRDQTAEFFLRNKQYGQAMALWVESLPAPSLDIIWLKALFWSKILTPVKFEWSKHAPPSTELEPLIKYILSLKVDQFWDDAKFEKIPNGQQFLKTQQTTFWLRLLSALKNNRLKEAMNLIEYNPFQKESWNPELELALLRVLSYQLRGSFNIGNLETPLKVVMDRNKSPNKPTIDLYKQIEELAQSENAEKEKGKEKQPPADLLVLLKSKDAYSALTLATEWLEAALDLRTSTIIPETYPDWYAYGIAQAIRINRSPMEALEFITKQKPTDTLQLLTAELLIAENSPQAALDILSKLAALNNNIGYRASWLESLIYIDQKNYAKARQTITNQPKLKNDVLGQETLARIALLEGHDDLADKIYTSLEGKSIEARSYLARKAFQAKNWKKSRELTEQLLKEFPNNITLRENLKQIITAEEKEKDTAKGSSKSPTQK